MAFMVRKKSLVVANWKMRPEGTKEVKKLFNAIRKTAENLKSTSVVVCPPFPYLYPLSKLRYPKNMFLGAQNIFENDGAAFTGEVSANMVKDLGGAFVIVGHSERRAMGENNEMVRKKLQTAINAGLTPLLCIGETERDKEGSHLSFIKNQIKECLSGLQKKNLIGLLVAYEPVWAIGKSYRESMNPTDIHEMTLFIKKIVGELFGADVSSSIRVLYGGSVEAENAAFVARLGNVDGFLVGHASLVPEEFSIILKASDVR